MIERIQIRGFKSIRELDLPLRSINLLIGANGVGKSNFISFFKLLNQLYEQRLQQYVAENGYIESLLFFGGKYADRIKGFVDFNNTNAYSFSIRPSGFDSAVLEAELDLWNGYGDKDKEYNQWHINYWTTTGRESSLKQNVSIQASHLKRFLQSFKIYHFHDTGATAAIKKASRIEDVQILYEDGRNLAAFLYYLQDRHLASFRQIEKAVQSVAPFFKEFNLFPSPHNKDAIQLVWKSVDNSEQNFFAFQLSDGTLRFMALATLLLQPEPPATILIDEPELGLHPFAIGKLAALLQKVSARSQVIISTQSVELLNHFEPADVVVVEQEPLSRPEPGQGPPAPRQSVFRRLKPSDLERWLENYTLGDLWKKNVLGGRP